ncbi:MAG: hypothetical protein ABJB01_10225 [Rudaea sp.]
MKILVALILALLPIATVFAASESCSVSMAQDPVVMRLGKDEFRIVFGLNSERCGARGCNGTISYSTEWTTEDGMARNEHKTLTYAVPDDAKRSLVVDRHYFDTSEGKHTTDIAHIRVEDVSCVPSAARATASR